MSSGSAYSLNKDLRSLSLSSNDHNSKPSASQAATSASRLATKRARVPAGAGKWQKFVKENNKEPVASTSGAKFTGFDRDGNAHQMVRPASTVGSDDDSDSTMADPRERARIAKEEVRIPARALVTRTDGGT